MILSSEECKSFDLGSYVRRTPMLIEFWATWCPQRHELEQALSAAHRKYANQMKFIGVAVSVRQSRERLKAYVAKHNQLTRFFDVDANASDAYEVPAASYFVVVNRKDEIVYTRLGGSQDLEAAIQKAIWIE